MEKKKILTIVGILAGIGVGVYGFFAIKKALDPSWISARKLKKAKKNRKITIKRTDEQ